MRGDKGGTLRGPSIPLAAHSPSPAHRLARDPSRPPHLSLCGLWQDDLPGPSSRASADEYQAMSKYFDRAPLALLFPDSQDDGDTELAAQAQRNRRTLAVSRASRVR